MSGFISGMISFLFINAIQAFIEIQTKNKTPNPSKSDHLEMLQILLLYQIVAFILTYQCLHVCLEDYMSCFAACFYKKVFHTNEYVIFLITLQFF